MNKFNINSKPNILFITADQWRGECLSAADHPQVKTPNLDKIALDGILFKEHFAQSIPCAPSRACLYTGTYLNYNRVVSNGSPLASNITNVALEARKKGYEPHLFGFTDTGLDPNTLNKNDPAAFHYSNILPGMTEGQKLCFPFNPWLNDLKKKGYKFKGNGFELFQPDSSYNSKKGDGKTLAPTKYNANDSNTAFLVNATMKHISSQENPWFVHLSILSPHSPFISPKPYNTMYSAADMPEPLRAKSAEEEAKIHPYVKASIYNQKTWPYSYGCESINNPNLNLTEFKQAKATYYGMMSEVDAQLGRLFEYLKKLGVYNNTLIIFTSDHGEQLGDHWHFSKDTYYEQSYKIPLIVKPPLKDIHRNKIGKSITYLTENIDIMPTILNSINQKIPTQCSGHDLSVFWKENQKQFNWRAFACSEFDFRSFGKGIVAKKLNLKQNECGVSILRDKNYKYIHFSSLPPLLFDLRKDPGELNNLIGNKEYNDIALKYAQMMMTWRMKHENNILSKYKTSKDGYIETI